MKKLMLLTALALLAPSVAMATDKGGPSASATAIAGSSSSLDAKLSNSLSSKNDVSNLNVYSPSNYNLGVNKQLQGQDQKQKQNQNNDQTIAPVQQTAIEFHEAKQVYQAPTVVAPNLSAGVFTCLGSKSGGLSLGTGVVGVGGSFGSTVKDEECNSRADAASIVGVEGAQVPDVIKNIARARLCQREAIQQAYAEAGVSCGKKADAKTAAAPAPLTGEVIGVTQQVLSTNFGVRDAVQGN